ncbi:MAG: hydrolase 1, exosortase A system-associated [Azoarcus sp.]|jgi:exosortase A-associated hydrolase 1|nr:hydrolase 1, exosortase A system-associated [Azoarcus sp.]
MDFHERAFFFDCEGDALPGIVALPCDAATAPHKVKIGVLIVVGGPQYRVGAHRQFVLLARALAAAGVPCMRFDWRGMGDAEGEPRRFDAVADDLRAALDAFFAAVPDMTGALLWGLCDGATAAALYAGDDPRVDGLLLLNPWLGGEEGGARVMLRHYYLKRLTSTAFWRKLVGGGVSPAAALADLWRFARGAFGGASKGSVADGYAEKLRLALKTLSIPWWVVLSGEDFVAREFERAVAAPEWAELLPARAPLRVAEADHTFSRAVWRDEVADKTLACVRALTDLAHRLDAL